MTQRPAILPAVPRVEPEIVPVTLEVPPIPARLAGPAGPEVVADLSAVAPDLSPVAAQLAPVVPQFPWSVARTLGRRRARHHRQ